jgi:hypothetical protein
MENKIRFKDKLSIKLARNKIIAFGLYGKDNKQYNLKTPKDVELYFYHKGINLDKLVEYCRDYKKKVPFLEGELSTTWNYGAFDKNFKPIKKSNSKIELINNITGKSEKTLTGEGEFAIYAYLSKFEDGIKHLNLAVENTSYEDFYTACSKGVTSIDAYLNYKAKFWNLMHEDKLIDNEQNKVSLDFKLTHWVKIMTNRGLKKDTIVWQNFKFLQKCRHKKDQHLVDEFIGGSFEDLVKDINKFKSGIAQLLANLHLIFGQRTPSKIISAIYLPDVELVN